MYLFANFCMNRVLSCMLVSFFDATPEAMRNGLSEQLSFPASAQFHPP